jgi:large subunit ribosomal protein L10
MNRQQKQAFVTEMNAQLQEVRALFLADFRGMSVARDTQFRAAMREAGVEMKVVKNRLFLRALEGTQFEGVVEDHLTGPNAVMFVGDLVAAEKALKDQLKDEELTLEVKGGALPQQELSAAEIEELASIPSREELIATFAGMLQSPLRDFATLLNTSLRDFANVVKALADNKEA